VCVFVCVCHTQTQTKKQTKDLIIGKTISLLAFHEFNLDNIQLSNFFCGYNSNIVISDPTLVSTLHLLRPTIIAPTSVSTPQTISDAIQHLVRKNTNISVKSCQVIESRNVLVAKTSSICGGRCWENRHHTNFWSFRCFQEKDALASVSCEKF